MARRDASFCARLWVSATRVSSLSSLYQGQGRTFQRLSEEKFPGAAGGNVKGWWPEAGRRDGQPGSVALALAGGERARARDHPRATQCASADRAGKALSLT